MFMTGDALNSFLHRTMSPFHVNAMLIDISSHVKRLRHLWGAASLLGKLNVGKVNAGQSLGKHLRLGGKVIISESIDMYIRAIAPASCAHFATS
jgi:hypothetical protein